MQGTSKQQKGQHALHHGCIEIDLPDGVLQGVGDAKRGKHIFQRQQGNRRHQGHDQKANRMRQVQYRVVEPAKEARQSQQQSGDFKQG